MSTPLTSLAIVCRNCRQSRPSDDFLSTTGRTLKTCTSCRQSVQRSKKRLRSNSAQDPPQQRSRTSYDVPREVVLRRGQDSQDTPGVAAQRREVVAVRRRHRLERRSGLNPSPTPRMPSYNRSPSPNDSDSRDPIRLSSRASYRSIASSTPSRPTTPSYVSQPASSSHSGLRSAPPTYEADPVPDLADPGWANTAALTDADQARLRKFHGHVASDREQLCVRCNESWFSDATYVNGVCTRCERVDRSRTPDEPFLFSDDNKLDPWPISHNLPELTPTEEMLISRVHVYMQVRQVRGAQYRYRGHVCNFMRNTAQVYNRLPCLPSDLDVVVLRPASTTSNPLLQRQFVRDFHVRREAIHLWLRFLRQNHSGYAAIQIDQGNLSRLPESGSVADEIDTRDFPDDDLPVSMTTSDFAEEDEPPDGAIVPDLQGSQTEVDALRRQFTTVTRHISMPSMRPTPINEFVQTQALLTLAFPTLFPYGKGEFNQSRRRTVSYDEYISHLMRYKDRRFAQHDRFRFVVYDTLMRRQIRSRSSFYVNRLRQADHGIGLDEIVAAFDENSDWSTAILNSITQYSRVLRGTRPFWGSRRLELEAMVRNLGSPHIFVTLSAADYHWDSLMKVLPNYDDWLQSTPERRVRLARAAVIKNPLIVAHHFHARFTAFRKHILEVKFNIVDFWYRYEWQSRGSVHCHGVYWCDGAPSPELHHDNLQQFAEFWGVHVVAWHPQIGLTDPPPANPLSLSPDDETHTFRELSTIINRVQVHVCRPDYCLRQKRGTGEEICRFNFPLPVRDTPTLEKPIGHTFLRFLARRNHVWLNNYSRAISLAWKANTDIAPCTGAAAMINYIGKYVSKAEDQSSTYREMATKLLPSVSRDNPLKSFVTKVMNRFIGERDISAQEVCHILSKLPLQQASRETIRVDLRPETDRDDRYDVDNDGVVSRGKSKLDKYLARAPALEDVSYFQFLRLYDFSPRATRPRPRARPRVLTYYPLYQPTEHYEDFSRAKLLLHIPFRNTNDLLRQDDMTFDSFREAYEYWSMVYPTREPEDFMQQPAVDEEEEDDDRELLANAIEDDPFPSTLEELARMRPAAGLETRLDDDSLGQRDVDKTYDWLRHVGTYNDLTTDYWKEAKQAHPVEVAVESTARPDQLNPRQRLLYETVVNHYMDVVQFRNPPQLLINLDGKAGTGKTFVVMLLSARLQQLANEYDRPPPLVRTAPTGVAAHAIQGHTLHQLFRLPLHLAKTYDRLGENARKELQNRLQHTNYIIIDEKSMLGLRSLAWIHHRCGEAFPERREVPFGGLNIILTGDFYQLPPVQAQPLFKQVADKPMEAEALYQYRQFDITIELRTVQRQMGADNAAVGFRLALDHLRERCVTVDDWALLCTRVQAQLPLGEVMTFDDAVRIYTTKADVVDYNEFKMRELDSPIVVLEAVHEAPSATLRSAAKKASTSEGGNVPVLLPLTIGCRVMLTQNIWVERGLVNGSMGTVGDITWSEGVEPRKSLPLAVMVAFDGYTGPTLTSHNLNRPVVPVFPVRRDFFIGNALCHRSQLPLTTAYAITVHKAQGMTLDRVVLNISKPDFAPGLTYVAVSRCKTLQGILFEEPFDYDRFGAQTNSKTDEARQSDRERRAAQHPPVHDD
jgi:ATP-dependent DNA helicase PIF1